MGVTFDRDMRIAGFRPSVFKAGLRAYLRTEDRASFLDLKSVVPMQRDAAIILEECLDRGLIDPATFKVTDRGMTVARSKVVARTPLTKARGVLSDLLDRIDQLNADPEAVTRVDEVWLYGSLMREEASVGDIDLAISRSRDARFGDKLHLQDEEAKRLVARFADAPKHFDWPWERIDWLYKRTIYGARRQPLLSGAQDGTTDLQSLAVPCRLIYDRARGGRVDDPILPRHPDSPGRANTLSPPEDMPDLVPAALRPMDARWITGFTGWQMVSPYDLFRGWTEECRRLFPGYPETLRVAASAAELAAIGGRSSATSVALDGRNAVVIADIAKRRGTRVTLTRAIDASGDVPILRAALVDGEFKGSPKYRDPLSMRYMAAAISLILATDAERLLRRASEEGRDPHVTIALSGAELAEELRTFFVEGTAGILTRRDVAIEPFGETASVTIEIV